MFRLINTDYYLTKGSYNFTDKEDSMRMCYSRQSKAGTVQQIKKFFGNPERNIWLDSDTQSENGRTVTWEDIEVVKYKLKETGTTTLKFLMAPKFIQKLNKKLGDLKNET